jgi:hypothetical protein
MPSGDKVLSNPSLFLNPHLSALFASFPLLCISLIIYPMFKFSRYVLSRESLLPFPTTLGSKFRC